MKETKRKKRLKEKGITLIALVVTIVILLILAAVTINMTLGSNGLFIRAQDSRAQYENSTANEVEQMNDVTGILEKVAKQNEEEKTTGEKIPIDETNHIGYYADIDGNGTVDGFIFADLSNDVSGTWSGKLWSNYSYDAQIGLKSYYISEIDHKQNWGTGTKEITADVIAPVDETTGKDRFYVMALEDFKQEERDSFYWYKNVRSSKLDRPIADGYDDFGEGKLNTIKMIDDWSNKASIYGSQTTTGTYIDIWGAIQDNQYSIVTNENDSAKWLIPSKAEWSAIGDYLYTKLNVKSDNYGEYGLSQWYWSSSQSTIGNAFTALFNLGYMYYGYMGTNLYVRLISTF